MTAVVVIEDGAILAFHSNHELVRELVLRAQGREEEVHLSFGRDRVEIHLDVPFRVVPCPQKTHSFRFQAGGGSRPYLEKVGVERPETGGPQLQSSATRQTGGVLRIDFRMSATSRALRVKRLVWGIARSPRSSWIMSHAQSTLASISWGFTMARSQTRPWYQVQRARIVLEMAEGGRTQVVAFRNRCDETIVPRICHRSERLGLPVLFALLQRPGRPLAISPLQRAADHRAGLSGADRRGAAHHALDQ